MFNTITCANESHTYLHNDSVHARRALLSSFDEAENDSNELDNDESDNVYSNRNNFSSTPPDKSYLSLPQNTSTAIVKYKPPSSTPITKQASGQSSSLTNKSRTLPFMSPVVPDTLSIIQEHIPQKQIANAT